MTRSRVAWLAALAGAGGLAAALGQVPWALWPLALAGYAAILGAVALAPRPGLAFGLGWLGGLAQFALALSWIVEPFWIEPERHAWLAPVALIVLPGGLALLWGAAGWAAARLAAPGAGRVWAFALTLTAAEAVRGYLFGGFPWAMPGHVWIETPLAQVAALAGPLGLTALALAPAAGLAALVLAPGRRAVAGLAVPAAIVAAAWGWGVAALSRPMPADRAPLVRLVQPNADQALKWHPDHAERFFRRHLDLTARPPAAGRAPDLVVWPETAVPFWLDAPGDGLWLAAQSAGGAPVALGIQRRGMGADGGWRYYNSLAVLDGQGEAVAIYDKHHLVPFGEYVPVLGALADSPGWAWTTAFVGSALLGYTPGPGPAVLDLGGDLGRVLPLICYEAVFPRHLRSDPRPDWVLQVTNDAWFGQVSGPYQHLALARLRAIEQGLPLIRVANTGVSAVIDARGRVRERLELGVEGVIDTPLPAALPPTPYARTGDWPAHLVLLAALGLLAGAARRRRIDTRGGQG